MPRNTEPSLTAYVAEFIVGTRASDIPADVTHLGKRSILDGIGLALAGSVAESGYLVRKHLRSLGCATTKGSTVIGSRMKLPARFAAFANGVAIHADDYDDTQLAVARDRVYGLLTHPTAPALPPVLALGERDRRSGRDVLTAYQVAVEVETKIAEAINPRHYQDGFHSTATVGAIVLPPAQHPCWVQPRADTARARHRREPGRGPARELRHHDEAVSCRPRVRKRRRRGRARKTRFTATPIILEADAASSRRPAAAMTRRRSTASSATRGRSRSPGSRSNRIRAAHSRIPAWD